MTTHSIWEFTGFMEQQSNHAPPTAAEQTFEHSLWQFAAASSAANLIESEDTLPFSDDATEQHTRLLHHHHAGASNDGRAFVQHAMMRLQDELRGLAPQVRARLWFIVGLGAFHWGRWNDADDAFATCARALTPHGPLAQQLQLAFYWGRAALYGHRPRQALLSFQRFITLWHSASATEIAAAVPRSPRSLLAYVHVQIARAEHELDRSRQACAEDLEAVGMVNQWVLEQRTTDTTIKRFPPGSVPLKELSPAISHQTPEEKPWFVLSLMAPWYYINHTMWEVRLAEYPTPKNTLDHRTWQPMRTLQENVALLIGAKSRQALHLYLHAADLALSGVRVAERADVADEANSWLVRAAHSQHALDQTFKITATDPQYNFWRLLRNEIWFRESVRVGDATETTQIVSDIEHHRDELHHHALPDLEAHAERLLGQCYTFIDPPNANPHFEKALDLLSRGQPQHVFSPHRREIEQALGTALRHKK
jgi:hypothetical protein